MAGHEPALTNLLALTEGHKETQGAYRSKAWR
jgi:putative protease